MADINITYLINKLPVVLQKKIFYFTMHPIAEIFKEEYNFYYDFINNNIEERKHYISSYRSSKLYYYNNFKYTDYIWDSDIKPLIICHAIIKNQRYKIIDSYLDLYNKSRFCNKCEDPVFNKFDKYCTECIKNICDMHSQIYNNDLLYQKLKSFYLKN